MKTWSLAVMALAVMSAGAVAQDVKGGEEKVAFEKKSYPYEGEVTVERLNVRMFPKNDQTSIITSVLGLGEKVTVERVDGTATYSSPGRPIAVISNVMIEYRPGPPPRAATPRRK